MIIRLRSVLSDRDLPVAELASARLDGELFPLGDFWCPVDEPNDQARRAQAAALLVSPRAIAERLTAAWIYGLAPEPRRHHFCVDVTARVHLQRSARLIVREVAATAGDTMAINGIRVMRPIRTIEDLARWPDPDVDVTALIGALLRFCGPNAAELARQRCDRAGVPFRSLALDRLKLAERLI